MKSRIKEIRKHFHLNQEEFGERIGIKQSTVTAYECGNRIPLDVTVTAICREFNVSEQWLREGTGEMFLPRSEVDELEDLFAEILKADDSDSVRKLAMAFSKLSSEERREAAELAVKLAKHM